MSIREGRSNKYFKSRALEILIKEQISLSTSRNPDFVNRHQNELKAKNQDWKKEITMRVQKEQNLRTKLQEVRLNKITSGTRRI